MNNEFLHNNAVALALLYLKTQIENLNFVATTAAVGRNECPHLGTLYTAYASRAREAFYS